MESTDIMQIETDPQSSDQGDPRPNLEVAPKRRPALIFDLDGTLTDSKPGIVGCLSKVLDAWCLDPAGPLDRFVGPPVEDWAVELLPDASDEDRAKLARDYRACYDLEGWCNNSVFDGVREMLNKLHQSRFLLFVCTSKQQRFAVRILEHFGLGGMFTGIYGDRPEYHDHGKAELLAAVLRENLIEKSDAMMIGDRIHDVHAARSNGIPCLAAGWGYGSTEEYLLADAIAPTPAELPALVFNQQYQKWRHEPVKGHRLAG